MALLEDMMKGSTATGVAVGLGALLLAPTLLPAIGRVLRPAAKAVIKGGIVVYRETVAEFGEVASDLFAEAQAELAHGNGHDQGAATAAVQHRGSHGEGREGR